LQVYSIEESIRDGWEWIEGEVRGGESGGRRRRRD
jgi:hypothetical protein